MTLLQQFPEVLLRPRSNLYENWMVPVFLLILCLLAYVRVVYNRRFGRLFSALFKSQILRQIMREELVFSHRASVVLSINFALTAGMFLYLLDSYNSLHLLGPGGYKTYGLYVALVIGIYLAKTFVINLLRFVFNDEGVLREYLFEVFLVNKAGALILLPVLLMLTFFNISAVENIVVLFAALVVLMFLFRTGRGLISALNYQVSGLYIILYLCTLEIIPLVLASKLLYKVI